VPQVLATEWQRAVIPLRLSLEVRPPADIHWAGLLHALLEYARTDRPDPEARRRASSSTGPPRCAPRATSPRVQRATAGDDRSRLRQAVAQAIDDPARGPPARALLAALAPALRGVVTTNLDRFIERAFSGAWHDQQTAWAGRRRLRLRLRDPRGGAQLSDDAQEGSPRG